MQGQGEKERHHCQTEAEAVRPKRQVDAVELGETKLRQLMIEGEPKSRKGRPQKSQKKRAPKKEARMGLVMKGPESRWVT
jgi:hypothetical protein